MKHVVEKGVSTQRKACLVLKQPRGSLRYRNGVRKDETKLVEQIHQLSKRYKRYGYRRIAQVLRREGWPVNRKRVHRLWKREGLQLPLRRPKRRQMGSATNLKRAEKKNQIWTYDFAEDRTEKGNRVRILVVLDECTRECLWLEAGASFPAARVIQALEWMFLIHGTPEAIRSDNGPEFIAGSLRDWLRDQGCQTAYIEPGSPWQNGCVESFIGKLRDECLNRNVFRNGREIQNVLDAWKEEYNERRPHSSLEYRTPKEYARMLMDRDGRMDESGIRPQVLGELLTEFPTRSTSLHHDSDGENKEKTLTPGGSKNGG